MSLFFFFRSKHLYEVDLCGHHNTNSSRYWSLKRPLLLKPEGRKSLGILWISWEQILWNCANNPCVWLPMYLSATNTIHTHTNTTLEIRKQVFGLHSGKTASLLIYWIWMISSGSGFRSSVTPRIRKRVMICCILKFQHKQRKNWNVYDIIGETTDKCRCTLHIAWLVCDWLICQLNFSVCVSLSFTFLNTPSTRPG